MRYMVTYDLMESMRNTNQWLGATAQALGSYPATGLVPHPMFTRDGRLGRGDRTQLRPHGGQARLGHLLRRRATTDATTSSRSDASWKSPFGDLIHFTRHGPPRTPAPRPAGGADVGPLRDAAALHGQEPPASTARSVSPTGTTPATFPVSRRQVRCRGLHPLPVDFMRHLGPDTNVVAVCQPVAAHAGRDRLSGRDCTPRRSRAR